MFQPGLKSLALLGACAALCLAAADTRGGMRRLSVDELRNLPALEVGDVVLRRGLGEDSAIIRYVSGSDYSHAGLVIKADPVLIIHAATDDDPRRPNQVITSSLASYVALSSGVAVVRYPLSAEARSAIAGASEAYLGKAFKLAPGSDALYCTTLVRDLLTPHTMTDLSCAHLDIPLLSGCYLYPQSFVDDFHGELIYRKLLPRGPGHRP